MLELKPQEFEWLRGVIKRAAGIHLTDGKETVIRARLGKRLRAIGCLDFESYIEQIESDASGSEMAAMIDAVTVNQTSFFREPTHFPVFQSVLSTLLEREPVVSVWSAGCATGEEPYTLAMLADSMVADVQERVRFLATDICSTVLAVAQKGIFPKRALRAIPENFLQYVTPTDSRETRYAIRPDIQNLVSFARLNLIGDWPMRGPMHVIFCRNVMMYFDSPARRRLATRFSQLLAPGGYLFVGHSEALPMNSGLDYIQPAVYQKPEGLR